jgi:hypothetical protein
LQSPNLILLIFPSQSLLDKEETVKRASFVEEPATLSKMHDLTHLNQMDESGPREIEAEHKHHQSAPLALLPKSRVDAIKCVVGTHDKLNEGVHVKDPHKVRHATFALLPIQAANSRQGL